MKDINELINSIYAELTNDKSEPAGINKNKYPGVPSSGDVADYVTHQPASMYNTRSQQPIESIVKEQEEEEDKDKQETPDTSDIGPDISGSMGDDKEDKPDFDASEIGKIYELKKIFSRLLSLEKYLNETSDELLVKLSKYVSEAINLFKLVINNVDDFIDEIDNIIVMFYDFLSTSYQLLRKFYNLKQKEEEQGDN